MSDRQSEPWDTPSGSGGGSSPWGRPETGDPGGQGAPGGPASSEPTAYGPTAGGQPGYGEPAYGHPAYGQPRYGQYGYPPQPGPGAPQGPYGPPGYPYAPPPTNTMAVLALVFAFVFAPVAIALGVMARKEIAHTGELGHGLATAGMWLGIAFTALFVVPVLIFIVFGIVAAGAASTGI